MAKEITVRGAREHNLKNITLSIPRDKLVVITGLSGSGKSSLAFDTIYAEGQRRYVESLSSYARQFLEQMPKPDVDAIEGLPPTISIEQRSGGANPRSTVATTTEIYDYLRLLFARVGDPFCHKCGKKIQQQSPEQIAKKIGALEAGTRVILLAPLIRGQKGEHREVLTRIKREGYIRARVDGVVQDLAQIPALAKSKKHLIEAVIDRLSIGGDIKARLQDSVETGLALGEGQLIASVEKNGRWTDRLFSEHYACAKCDISFEELAPRMFSFNSPYGACATCGGLGTRMKLDEEFIVPDKTLSIQDGALEAWRKGGKRMAIYYNRLLRKCAKGFDFSLQTRFKDLPEAIQRILVFGSTPKDEKQYGATFEGVIPNLEKRFGKTTSDYVKKRILSYMSELPCPKCKGARLRPEALAVTVSKKSIRDVTHMPIGEAYEFFSTLRLNKERKTIAKLILKEVISRLRFMSDVGLSYLTLDRKSGTLSGGEAQRIRLASQVGSSLVGVCYVLDEPTIGLHHRDNAKLLRTLKHLRDMGNSVVVVEHDEETILAADLLIDIGPGAGAHGGEVVAYGTPKEVTANRASVTGKYLSSELYIPVPKQRRPFDPTRCIEVRGGRANNLKRVNVKIPLGAFVCVTGVSGSGKSTLVNEILHKGLKRKLYRTKDKPGAHDEIRGAEQIDKIIEIDQSPIGRTPRSNPATYSGAFDEIRKLFSMVREAKIRGYKPGRFSFNVKGGRCESCQGQGTKKIEMHFLPDIYVVCEECKGRRYNRESLEIKYKGFSISQVLDMRIEEAHTFFKNVPKIARVLRTLIDVGLAYMTLGQPSTTLSGGEAQRVKLAAELAKVSTGNTFYILDEPTTGLHFADISKLLDVLHRLTDLGNTVLVIEHNLDVIKMADHIIDLGPEGGDGGGRVVATGTPEELAAHDKSYTGEYLRPLLKNGRR